MVNPIEYAKRGWYIFPCRADKRPHIKGWPGLATTEEAQIAAWAAQFPGCRWGVAAGPSGLFILDVDVKNGAGGRESLAALEAEHGKLPRTFRVRSKSGGTHLYFRGQGRTTAGVLGSGLDIRSAGGFVVAPDGRDYIVEDDAPPATTPAWLLALAGAAREKAPDAAGVLHVAGDGDVADAAAWLATEAPRAVVGSRDNTTFQVAAKLRSRFGVDADTARRLMAGVWLPLCDESGDWSEEDVAAKIRSAYGGNALLAQGEEHPAAMFSSVEGGIVPAGKNPFAVTPAEIACTGFGISRPPEREMLWGGPGGLPLGVVGILAGQGGAGKSTLALQIAVSIASGHDACAGMFALGGCQGAVLLINAEDDRTEAERRVFEVRQHFCGMEWDTGKLHVIGRGGDFSLLRRDAAGNLLPTEAMASLLGLVREIKPRLVVLDPISKLSGPANIDSSNAEATAFLGQLERVALAAGGSVIALHHVAKGSLATKSQGGKAPKTVDEVKRGLESALSVAAVRGASALVDTARWAMLTTLLTEGHKKAVGEEPGAHVAAWRVAKNNHGALTGTAFLRRAGETGPLIPFEPTGAHEETTDELKEIILRTLEFDGPTAKRRACKSLAQRPDLPGQHAIARILEELVAEGRLTEAPGERGATILSVAGGVE